MESSIVEQYTKSARSLFLLDYDGTLADFTSKPKDARLTSTQYKTLQALCQNPRNTVVIISGRDRHSLDEWLADLPINLAAEYGNLTKEQDKPWHIRPGHKKDWKQAVRPVFEKLVDAVPGSFIENKEFSLVWHYWGIDDDIAAHAADKQHRRLDRLAKKYNLAIKPATKVIELTVPGIDKAAVALQWLERQHWDFILAAGDDNADEVLFKAMPKSVITIKVGRGKTTAQYRLPSPTALSKLLKQFTIHP